MHSVIKLLLEGFSILVIMIHLFWICNIKFCSILLRWKPHLKFLWGIVDFDTDIEDTVNGSNFTMRLTWNLWNCTLNVWEKLNHITLNGDSTVSLIVKSCYNTLCYSFVYHNRVLSLYTKQTSYLHLHQTACHEVETSALSTSCSLNKYRFVNGLK